jgi:osmotically-inducible protein OsmY
MKACRILLAIVCVFIIVQASWAQERSDAEIRAELQKRVQPNTGITLTVEKGVVTLTGDLQSYAQKTSILNITRRVIGVSQVIDHIKVVPKQAHSDSEISASVRRVLVGNLTVEEMAAVSIGVDKGVVTLSGTLPSSYPKQVAGMLSGWVQGVVGLNNNIIVKPSELRSDLDISADIRDRFHKNPFIANQKINVTVTNGVVTLHGVVDNDLAADQAESVARFTPGVVEVNNLIFLRSIGN